MGGKTSRVTIETTVRDGASKTLSRIAIEADKMAAAQVAAGQKLIKASGGVTNAQKAKITATKAVTLAVREQQAAGRPLATTLIKLERTYLTLEAQMRKIHRQGKAIPPEMAKQVATSRAAAIALEKQAIASNTVAASQKTMGASLMAARMHILAVKIAIALAVRATIRFMFNFAKLGDNIDKTSKKLGIGTEALQLWRRSAELAGAEQKGFDTGLKMLNKAIGEARDGMTEYTRSFDQLGISEATLANGELADILPLVANALQSMGSEADRTKIAMKLLGRSGADLLPMLTQGAGALAAQAAETKRLGIITQEQVDLSAILTDESRDLNQSYEALKGTLFEELAPALIKTVENLTELSIIVRENWGMVVGLKDAMVSAISTLSPFSSTLHAVAGAFGEVNDAEAEYIASMGGIIDVTKDLGKEQKTTYASSDALAKQLEKVWKSKDKSKPKSKGPGIVFDFDAMDAHAKAVEAMAIKNFVFRQGQERKFSAFFKEQAEMRQGIRGKIALDLETARTKQLDDFKALQAKQTAASVQAAEQQAQAWASTAESMGAAIGAAMGQMTDDVAGGAKMMLKAIIGMVKKAVMAWAAQWAVAAGASQAGTPLIGPFLAVGAAATAFGVAETYAQGFNSGGTVRGGKEGEDSVPAWLTPGEVVWPVPMVRQMRRLMSMSGGTTSEVSGSQQFNKGGTVQKSGGVGRTVNVSINLSTLEVPTVSGMDRLIRDSVVPSMRRLGHAI